jgi:hypothetical protein
LQDLFPDFPEPFTVADILEHTVLKIADDIELDGSTRAWSVPFSEAITDCCEREIDQWDVRVLQEIARRSPPPQ